MMKHSNQDEDEEADFERKASNLESFVLLIVIILAHI